MATMQISLLLSSLFVVLLFPCASFASLEILGERTDVYTLEGRTYQNKTISIQCGFASFGVNVTRRVNSSDGSGTSTELKILCGRPRYRLDANIVGWVPRDGRFQVAETCVVRYPFAVPSDEALAAPTADVEVDGDGGQFTTQGMRSSGGRVKLATATMMPAGEFFAKTRHRTRRTVSEMATMDDEDDDASEEDDNIDAFIDWLGEERSDGPGHTHAEREVLRRNPGSARAAALFSARMKSATLRTSSLSSIRRRHKTKAAAAKELFDSTKTNGWQTQVKVPRSAFSKFMRRPVGRASFGLLSAVTVASVGIDLACRFGGVLCPKVPGLDAIKNDIRDLSSMVTELDAAQTRRTDLLNATVRAAATKFELIDEMARLSNKFDSLIANNFSSLTQRIDEAQTRALDEAKRYIRELGNELNATMTMIKEDLTDVADNAVATAQLLNATISGVDQRLVNATRDINTNMGRLQQNTDTLRAETLAQFRSLLARIRAASSLFRRFVANTDRRFLRTDLYVNLLDQFNRLRDEVVTQGEYEPFLIDPGSPPNASSPYFQSVFLDEVRLVYSTNRTAGGQWGRMARFQLRCTTAFLIFQEYGFNGYEDLLSMIGPNGCSIAAGNCTCWVVYSNYRCILNTGVHVAPEFTDSLELNSTFCQTASTVTLAEGQIIDSPAELYTALVDDHCYEPASLGTFFRIWSVNTERRGMLAHTGGADGSVSRCNSTFDVLMDTRHPPSYIYLVVNILLDALGLPALYMDSLLDARLGRISNDVTYREYPFTKINGSLAQCMALSFMSYSPASEWLPVYRLDFRDTLTHVQVFADGQLIDQTTQVTLDASYAALLASSPFLVGFIDGGPDLEAFDVPQREISPSPLAGTRAGTITMAMCTNDPRDVGLAAAGCGPANWTITNNARFNHEDGINIPQIYYTPIDSEGFCALSERKIGSGNWCTIRDNFLVDFFPGQDGIGEGVAELQPREGSYITNIRVPEGQIFTELTRTCPLIETRQIGPQRMAAVLQNTRDLTVLVNIRPDIGLNDACTIPIQVQLSPRQTLEVPLPPCSFDTSRPRNITVTTVRGVSDIDLCTAQPLNVTANRATYVDVYGNPDTTEVTRISKVALDAAAQASLQISADLASLSYDILWAMTNISFTHGLPIDPIAYAPMDELRNRSREIIIRTLRTQQNVTNRTFPDFAGSADNATRAMEAYINTTLLALKERDDAIAALRANTAEQELKIQELINATKFFRNVSDLLVREQRRVDNLSIAVANQTIKIFSGIVWSMERFGLDARFPNLFKKVKDGLAWAADKGQDGIERLGEILVDIVEEVAEAAKDFASGIGNLTQGAFNRLIMILVSVIGGIILLVGGFIFIKWLAGRAAAKAAEKTPAAMEEGGKPSTATRSKRRPYRRGMAPTTEEEVDDFGAIG